MEGYLTLSRPNAWIAGFCLLLAVAFGIMWSYIALAAVAAAGLIVLYLLLRNPFWAFLAFMFSLPFATLRLIPVRGISNLAFMAVIVLFFSMLLNLRRLPAFRLGDLGAKPWLFATFIALAMLGTLFSVDQGVAAKFTGMAVTVFSLYFVGTLLLTTPERWHQAANSFLLGALASAIIILYDFFFSTRALHDGLYRAGFYTGAGAIGITISFLVAVPLALILVEKEKRPHIRVFYYLAALTSVGVILFSATRSAWLALAVLVLIEFIRRPGRTLVALGLIVVLIAGMVRAYLPSTYAQYAVRIYNAMHPEYAPQVQIGFRVENYNVALRMLASYPALGVGMNNFAAHAERFGRVSIPTDFRLNAHNAFLELLTGAGLLGGIAYILVWLLTFYEFIFVARRGPPSMRPLAIGLALGFLMFTIHSMFHSPHSVLLLAPIFALGSVMRREVLRRQVPSESG
ncbi:O-antigen ligase family protein [bacterium]|nr:O-antigen ligase family protein [bacterium]